MSNKYVEQVISDLVRLCGLGQEQAESYSARVLEMFSQGLSRTEIVSVIKGELPS